MRGPHAFPGSLPKVCSPTAGDLPCTPTLPTVPSVGVRALFQEAQTHTLQGNPVSSRGVEMQALDPLVGLSLSRRILLGKEDVRKSVLGTFQPDKQGLGSECRQ